MSVIPWFLDKLVGIYFQWYGGPVQIVIFKHFKIVNVVCISWNIDDGVFEHEVVLCDN